MGYACAPGASIALKRRSSGIVRPSPAADVLASEDVMKLPALFLRSAVVKLFARAYAYST